jgi:hypothetical protein
MDEDPLDFDEVNVNPQTVIIHSKYDRNNFANDIALIKLTKRLTFKGEAYVRGRPYITYPSSISLGF